MNYFEFFRLPLSFQLDEEALRKAFYANSKKYHPDFYTLESEEKQTEILELSTINNQAYHTLA
ncbi:MAG TPA: Fe-S protein assembly co-chaperone HscB, partial [Saprospiraceae bacterium]|nr:Fe-S protein assembly co-chaperone HscB [Saprospiraceae bacterium]